MVVVDGASEQLVQFEGHTLDFVAVLGEDLDDEGVGKDLLVCDCDFLAMGILPLSSTSTYCEKFALHGHVLVREVHAHLVRNLELYIVHILRSTSRTFNLLVRHRFSTLNSNSKGTFIRDFCGLNFDSVNWVLWLWCRVGRGLALTHSAPILSLILIIYKESLTNK